MGRKAMSIFCRFLAKIKEDETTGCWIWQGSKDQHGYGKLSSKHGMTPHKAHRLSYQLFKGDIPLNMFVLHDCDDPSCVNPSHLKAGTQKDNMQDAAKRNRLNTKSLLNLRPGAKGHSGAGPKSNKELSHGRS